MNTQDRAREMEGRLWPNVDKRGPDECWEWSGKKHKGYGYFTLNGKTTKPHRVAMMLDGHEIPAGMVVDHICRNRACCNPRHLRVVTPRINTLENSVAVTAINAAKTHCVRGHELTDDNVYSHRGWRECRKCKQIIKKIYRRRRRAREMMDMAT